MTPFTLSHPEWNFKRTFSHNHRIQPYSPSYEAVVVVVLLQILTSCWARPDLVCECLRRITRVTSRTARAPITEDNGRRQRRLGLFVTLRCCSRLCFVRIMIIYAFNQQQQISERPKEYLKRILQKKWSALTLKYLRRFEVDYILRTLWIDSRAIWVFYYG